MRKNINAKGFGYETQKFNPEINMSPILINGAYSS